MKISRLIGIITILLQQEKTTVSRLADRFEVSERTIRRDIDDICLAGIPIVTTRGYGGGIRIADGYKSDKTLLTQSELELLLTGLHSLESISGTAHTRSIAEKFSAGTNSVFAEREKILIDLASWHKADIPDKINTIKEAITNSQKISFAYFSPKGESVRTIEPYLILFKWGSWYVYGYCAERRDFRMFKLARMRLPQNTGEHFELRRLPDDAKDFEKHFMRENIALVAVFDPRSEYRLTEEYSPDCFERLPDGKLLFRSNFVNSEYMTEWILSFGDRVKVLEPPELARTICRHAKNILNNCRE